MSDIAVTNGKAVLKKWRLEQHEVEATSKEELLAVVVNAIESAERMLTEAKKGLMAMAIYDVQTDDEAAAR
jgi:hypothetical protein